MDMRRDASAIAAARVRATPAMRADVQVLLVLPLLTGGVSAQSVLQPGDLHFKKGIGGGGDCGDLDEGGLSTVTWWYDWGHTAKGFAACNGTSPKHAEYIPMIWGKWGEWTQQETDIRTHAPSARFLFSYNEPDHSGSSYLNPADAADRWENMERLAWSLNVTLIGPCVSNYNSGEWWLHTFSESFANTTGRQPRMDHMCLHACKHESCPPCRAVWIQRLGLTRANRELSDPNLLLSDPDSQSSD